MPFSRSVSRMLLPFTDRSLCRPSFVTAVTVGPGAVAEIISAAVSETVSGAFSGAVLGAVLGSVLDAVFRDLPGIFLSLQDVLGHLLQSCS